MAKDALAIALHFLKFRPRSEFEIQKKLESKAVDGSEIERVISLLKKEKLLDDKKFAKMWVESRNNLKPSGSFVLKMELSKLGVAKEIIEDALKNQDQEGLARKAIGEKARYRGAEFERKAAFLARRGFPANVIYRVLK